MPVLVKETTLQAAVPSTAAELLKSCPNSPYTSLLVTSRGYISSLDQHCTRLLSGLTRLRSERNGAAKDLAPERRPNSPRDCDEPNLTLNLRDRVVFAVQLAVSSCHLSEKDRETAVPVMVTLVIDNRPTADPSGALLAYATALVLPNETESIEVACMAPPRQLPDVKHSDWALTRQQYTDVLPATAAEGLLCSCGGELLEGFISNLFIVQPTDMGLLVQTAVDGALAGIKQREVLDACQALRIRTQRKAALKQERHLWTEAFLTNAVRGLRPIRTITCPAQNALDWDTWEIHFPAYNEDSVFTRVQSYMQVKCAQDLFQLCTD
ncbi:hypothetical protein WJX79_007558 [Trebouxia sp. C0005]